MNAIWFCSMLALNCKPLFAAYAPNPARPMPAYRAPCPITFNP